MKNQFIYPMYTVWAKDNQDHDFQTLTEALKYFYDNKDSELINRHDDYALSAPVTIIEREF